MISVTRPWNRKPYRKVVREIGREEGRKREWDGGKERGGGR